MTLSVLIYVISYSLARESPSEPWCEPLGEHLPIAYAVFPSCSYFPRSLIPLSAEGRTAGWGMADGAGGVGLGTGRSPPAVEFGEMLFDLDFSPAGNVCAVGAVTGDVTVVEFGGREAGSGGGGEAWSRVAHSLRGKHGGESCRAVRFGGDGATLYSGGGDLAIHAVDVETGRASGTLANAHGSAVNCLCVCGSGGGLVASGDDDGVVRFWDVRQARQAGSFEKCQTDFISDMCWVPEVGHLLATSGDGTLASFDLRKLSGIKAAQRSDEDEELLSVVCLKRGRKVVCGTQLGVLQVFSCGKLGDVTDRFPGHPQSVDTLLKIDEGTVCSGSSDGLVRVLSIQPNKMLGVLGEHADFPVERIAKSCDGWVLGSISHDETLRFWDISALTADGGGGDEAEDVEVKDGKGGGGAAAGGSASGAAAVTPAVNEVKGKSKAEESMDVSGSGSEFDSEDFSDSSESSAEARSNRVKKGGRDFSRGNNGFFDGL